LVATLAVKACSFKLRIPANLWQNFSDNFADTTGVADILGGFDAKGVAAELARTTAGIGAFGFAAQPASPDEFEP
jgi:hypothetical protein